VTYLDDDPLTTSVWTWDEPGFARYDFGPGWAEHVSDPQVFVDAQKSDGCGNGCSKVDNLRWPADAAAIGASIESSAPAATSEPTEVAEEIESTLEPRVLGAVAPGAWMLPSWSTDEVSLALAAPMSIDEALAPESLPVDLPEGIEYQLPPENCADEGVGRDSCSTRRLQAISFSDVRVEAGQCLVMTGDAIRITQTGTDELLAPRPDGEQLHDLWVVCNIDREAFGVDINAPYGSFRGWHTAPAGWTPELVDAMVRFYIQAFNLQLRPASEIQPTPVPNCESSTGCDSVAVRTVLVSENQMLEFLARWFEKLEEHWHPLPVQ
jgi:hypothetical protein